MSKWSWGKKVPIPERIRNRRQALRMAAAELARRVGISSPYVSLIEKGAKVPSEKIAVKIADVLEDDRELYRAWVHADPHPDLQAHAKRLLRYDAVSSQPALRARLRRGESVPQEVDPEAGLPRASLRRQRWKKRSAGERDLRIEVPVLEDGVDPGDDPHAASGVAERLQLDARLLPPDVRRPFAYRPGAAAVARVRGLIDEGDLVILDVASTEIDPTAVYAVRHEGRTLLSKVVRHTGVLLLMSSDPNDAPIAIDLRSDEDLRDLLAGIVISTTRSWGRGSFRR